MKIAIHSDLHTEFGHGFPEGFLEDKNFDVLVLAGDISNVDVFGGYLQEIRNMIPDKEIIFVPGNHDFYSKHKDFHTSFDLLDTTCEHYGVQCLYREVRSLQGLRFIGCVGWPNLKAVKGYVDEWDRVVVERSIADFNWIKNWSVDRMLDEANRDYDFIRTVLKVPHPKTVVITHYPPSLLLWNPHYQINPLTSYFHNEYPEFFETENKPAAWIYGHTHYGVNREINGVQCYSNQLGYKGEIAGYNPNFIVEI
jgi:predicted phosphodiesterase